MKTTPAIDIVNFFYDDIMFGLNTLQNKIGFLNVGYWKGVNEDSMEIAQINLVETLIQFFVRTDGNILDVACGKGASTKFLTKYFDPRKVLGINISKKQLEVCRLIASECTFQLMDATRLEFDDSSYDNVLCVEAAFHFMTRHGFLKEAYRILKPEGRLSMSDILFGPSAHEIYHRSLFKENFLPDLEAYRKMLHGLGFRYVRVEDSTQFATDGLSRIITKQYERDINDVYRQKDYEAMQRLAAAQPTCCMVYAIK